MAPEVRSYVTFDLTETTGSLQSATLWLHASTPSAVGVVVRSVSGNKTFHEKTVTYKNAPAISTVGGAASGPVDAGWAGVDVTSLIPGGAANVTLALTTDSPAELVFSSRESGGLAPRLELVTVAPPVDSVPPVVSLTVPAAGSTVVTGTPTFSGAAGSEVGDLATVTVKVWAGSGVSGSPVQTLSASRSGGSYSVLAGSPLGSGVYTARAEQSDQAGNTGLSSANTFTIETGAEPDTAITSGPSQTVRTGTATFTFSASIPGATFLCALDGAAFTPCASPKTYHVANGGHSIAVRAVSGSASDPTPAMQTWWADALLENGNFETSVLGWRVQDYVVPAWRGYKAGIALVSGGNAGDGAIRVSYTSGGDYSVYTSPRPVNSTVAGTVHTGTGSVRSTKPGKSVCMRFREWAGSTVVGSAQRCMTTTSAWQTYLPLSYTAVGSGNELEIYFFQTSAVSGDGFDLDGLAITDGSPDPGPVPPESGDPVLLALADISYCWSSGEAATARLADTLAGTIAIAGDTEQNNGTAEEFQGCYEPYWGRHKQRTRPAVGDHEYRTAGAAPYFAYFGASAGPAGKGWYSYDLGEWHIVVLNSNCTQIGGCGPGSEQYEWLRQDLAANAKTCSAAYFHHPRWSSGSVHGSQTSVAPFWNVLYEFGVEFVFGGNDHTYQRFAKQAPGGELDVSRGIRQFVVGTGGAMHYALGPPIPNLQVAHTGTFGVTKFTLRPGRYDWQFIPQSGKTFTDSGSEGCH